MTLAINGLRGVKTIPNNWFFTVTDPTQTGNPVVGCGAVVPNGTTGTAVLGTVPVACTTDTTTPVANPTTVVPTTTVPTDPTTAVAATVAANPTTVTVVPTAPACSNTDTGGVVTKSPPANPSDGKNTSKNRPYGGHKGRGW